MRKPLNQLNLIFIKTKKPNLSNLVKPKTQISRNNVKMKLKLKTNKSMKN